MAEFTTLEIAQRCQRTERTVQRWLSEGKLQARHIKGNLYELSEDDLVPFLPHQVVDEYMERLSALERRVNDLEAILKDMSHKSSIRRLTPVRASYEHNEASETDTLPAEYVALSDLLKEHGLTSQRQSILRQMEHRGLLKKGEWKYKGHHVNNALDDAGVEEFLHLFVDDWN